MNYLTLNINNIIIQESPNIVSHNLVSPMCSKILCHTLKNFPPAKSNPKISLICDVAIIIAAAEVNPTATGPLMKSIKKPIKKYNLIYHEYKTKFSIYNNLPNCKIPINNSTHPDKKQSKTANSGPKL